MIKHLSVRVDEDLAKKIKIRAVEEGISLQELISRQLQKYLEESCPECQSDYIIDKQGKPDDIG